MELTDPLRMKAIENVIQDHISAWKHRCEIETNEWLEREYFRCRFMGICPDSYTLGLLTKEINKRKLLGVLDL